MVSTDGIEIVPAYKHTEEIRALFSEYTDMLIANDKTFQEYLAIQHYNDEIKHLEEKYGYPWGQIVSGLLRHRGGRLYRIEKD